jgi:hypothetical protein
VFLYDGAIVPDPQGIITAALTTMFKNISANNRAGGWRRFKHES